MSEATPFIDGYRLIDGTDLNTQLANPTWSISMDVAATPGGSAATSTKIVETITQVSTASVPNAGVVLPQAISPGRIFMIINQSSNPITVFADGGSTINGIPGTIGFTQETDDGSYYIAIAVNSWYKLDFLPVGFPKSFVETLLNITALRAWSNTSASSPAIIALVENSIPNDGGGLFWIDVTDHTTPDNGTTVIVDTVGNRWKREIVSGNYISNVPAGIVTASTVQGAINELANEIVNVIATQLPQTATIATLRNISPSTWANIFVAGYYTSGDGAGGEFYSVTGAAPGTYVENGGTIILPTGGDGSSAWLRTYTESVFDVRWFGTKQDGATDDSPFIQAAVDAAELIGKPYTLLFPAGATYLIKTPIRFIQGDVEICGGGTLNINSVNFPTGIFIGGYTADARAGFLFWNGNYVYSNGLTDQTYDATLQQNINIHNLRFYDSFSQATAYTQYSTAIMLAWCGNISIKNCSFAGFAGEIILGNVKNFDISNNYCYNSSNQFISMFDYNGVVSENICYLAGSFYEGFGHNVAIVNNVLDFCGTQRGTVPTQYIISLGTGAVLVDTQCVVANNVITNCNVSYAIQFVDSTANTLVDLQILNNYVQGYTVNAFIYAFTTASAGGSLQISNNVVIEDATNPYNFSAMIAIDNGFASSQPPAFNLVDNQCVLQSTAKAITVIQTANIQNGVIRGNIIKLVGTLRAGVSGYSPAYSKKTIWLSITQSQDAFGFPDLIVKDNIVDNIVCSDDTIRLTDIDVNNFLVTNGRSFVELDAATAFTVYGITGQIGQTITIHVIGANSVTFFPTVNLQTSTGAPEVVAPGELYILCTYAFMPGTNTATIAKALGAPITI